MRQILKLFAVFIVAGCGTPSGKIGPPYVDSTAYELKIEENFTAKRFEITLTSRSNKSLCVAFGDWPNGNGNLEWAADIVFVEVSGRKYPIRDHNFGYGPGETYIRIRPMGTIKSFIPFSEFDKEAFLYEGAERILHYEVRPVFCRKIRP